jgi:hypothetical protein
MSVSQQEPDVWPSYEAEPICGSALASVADYLANCANILTNDNFASVFAYFYPLLPSFCGVGSLV